MIVQNHNGRDFHEFSRAAICHIGIAGHLMEREELKTHNITRRKPVIVVIDETGAKTVFDANKWFVFWERKEKSNERTDGTSGAGTLGA